jgi:hypothetical protein
LHLKTELFLGDQRRTNFPQLLKTMSRIKEHLKLLVTRQPCGDRAELKSATSSLETFLKATNQRYLTMGLQVEKEHARL